MAGRHQGRKERKNRKLPPIGTELSCFLLNIFLGLKIKKNPNFSTFLLVVQFMMQIKFNFNNFTFLWQRASGIRRPRWRLGLVYPVLEVGKKKHR